MLGAMRTTLTMDKAGSLVQPKRLREKLRLGEGSKFEVQLVGDKIVLEEVAEPVRILRGKSGRRIVMGGEGFDAAMAVRDMRKDRMQRLLAPFEP